MPIYEYECGACAERHEFIQKFSDGPKRKCPSCGKSRLRKLVSAAAFHLKGEGWYVTDFRDKDKKKNGKDGKDGKEDKSASTEAKSDSKGDASTGSTSESKPDAKSSESKPEKKAGSSSKKGDSSATSAP